MRTKVFDEALKVKHSIFNTVHDVKEVNVLPHFFNDGEVFTFNGRSYKSYITPGDFYVDTQNVFNVVGMMLNKKYFEKAMMDATNTSGELSFTIYNRYDDMLYLEFSIGEQTLTLYLYDKEDVLKSEKILYSNGTWYTNKIEFKFEEGWYIDEAIYPDYFTTEQLFNAYMLEFLNSQEPGFMNWGIAIGEKNRSSIEEDSEIYFGYAFANMDLYSNIVRSLNSSLTDRIYVEVFDDYDDHTLGSCTVDLSYMFSGSTGGYDCVKDILNTMVEMWFNNWQPAINQIYIFAESDIEFIDFDEIAGGLFNGNRDVTGYCYKCRKLKTVKNLKLNHSSNMITDRLFEGCENLEDLTGLNNIRWGITIGGNNWGHKLTMESLLHVMQECRHRRDLTKNVLHLGDFNYNRVKDLYVRLTEEDKPEDENNKKYPFEICNSTDEGAITIQDYLAMKNWTIMV